MMQYLYIKSSYEFLQTHFKSEINNFLDSFQTERILILIAFLIGFLVAFIFIWSPYINRIARDVNNKKNNFIYYFFRFGIQDHYWVLFLCQKSKESNLSTDLLKNIL